MLSTKMLKVNEKPDQTAKNKRLIEIATKALSEAPLHEQLHLKLMKLVLGKLEQTSAADNVSVVQEAILIYENAYSKVPKLSICLNMLDEATKHHPVAVTLEKRILSDMRKNYLREPLFWHSIAQRDLKRQITYNSEAYYLQDIIADPTLQYFMCVEIYKTAVELINNNIMWTFYLDGIQMMQSYNVNDNIEVKQHLLKDAYKSAESANQMTEPHYVHFITYLKKNDSPEISDVISRAITAFPNAVGIWMENMDHCMAHGTAEDVKKVFKQARKRLGTHAYPIWRYYLLYSMKRFGDIAECDSFVEKIVRQKHEFLDDLKPSCLEWVFAMKGMSELRAFYKRVCLSGYPSLGFHQKMAKFEEGVLEPDTNTWRMALENTVKSYGHDRIDVWLDYVRFHQKFNNAAEIEAIATRAKAALTVDLADLFANELTTLKQNK